MARNPSTLFCERVSIITVDISTAYLGQLEVFADPVNRNEGSFSKGLKAVRLTTASNTNCYNPGGKRNFTATIAPLLLG